MVTFYRWLANQASRQDSVGLLAREVKRDPLFPRHTSKLGLCLQRFEDDIDRRNAVKTAHREWRRVRLGRRSVA